MGRGKALSNGKMPISRHHRVTVKDYNLVTTNERRKAHISRQLINVKMPISGNHWLTLKGPNLVTTMG